MTFGSCQGQLLNSGTYFGNTQAIRTLLKVSMAEMTHCSVADDQKLYTLACKNNNDLFYLDAQHRLGVVCDVPKSRDRLIVSPDLSVTYTDANGVRSRPMVAHFTYNGNMTTLIKKLGYQIDEHKHQQRDDYFSKLYYHHAKMFYHQYTSFCICSLAAVMILMYSLFRRCG